MTLPASDCSDSYTQLHDYKGLPGWAVSHQQEMPVGCCPCKVGPRRMITETEEPASIASTPHQTPKNSALQFADTPNPGAQQRNSQECFM